MDITLLDKGHIPAIIALMEQGAPFVRARGESEYWLYAELFQDTCPIVTDGEKILGAVIAFHSQVNDSDTYIQDVMVAPDQRRSGIASVLVNHVADQARRKGRSRLYLTSEPDNVGAHSTWLRLGFTNRPGDWEEDDVQVVADFKGAGKHRAVYDLDLT